MNYIELEINYRIRAKHKRNVTFLSGVLAFLTLFTRQPKQNLKNKHSNRQTHANKVNKKRTLHVVKRQPSDFVSPSRTVLRVVTLQLVGTFEFPDELRDHAVLHEFHSQVVYRLEEVVISTYVHRRLQLHDFEFVDYGGHVRMGKKDPVANDAGEILFFCHCVQVVVHFCSVCSLSK